MVRPLLPRKCKTLGISAPSPGGIQKGPATPKGVAKRKAPAKAKPRAKAQRQQAVAAAAAAPAAPAPAPDAWTQYGDSDGSAILQCWDDLGNAIREYVDVHCVHQPAWNTLETSIKKSLSRVSRRAREYYGFTAGAKTLFEALIWRSLVDMLFHPIATDEIEDIEGWPGYTALLLKFDDDLASLPPNRLKALQDPASILAWNQDETQLDPNQANLNQFGQLPADQFPAPRVPAQPAPGWKDQGSHHLKQLFYNWRPRMAEMMQLATGNRGRFDRAHVELRIQWTIPVNLIYVGPGQGNHHLWMQKTIAEIALRADRLIQLSSLRWEFQFEDPYAQGPPPGPGMAYDDSQGLMTLTHMQWDQQPHAARRQVDHVVRPLLRCYTLDPDAKRWDKLHHVRPMQVVIYAKGRKVPVPAAAAAAGGSSGNAGNAGNAGNP